MTLQKYQANLICGARGQNLGHLSKVLFFFSDLCRYLTKHLLENIHIWIIGTMVWLASTQLLQTHSYMLELKIYDIFRFFGHMGIGLGKVKASTGGICASEGTFSS